MNRGGKKNIDKEIMDKEIIDKKNGIGIRKMLLTDVPQVCEIEKRTFSIPWSEKAFEDSLKLPHALFVVACLGEQILGYCGLYQVFNEGDITNIAVNPKYRKHGVASNLLLNLLDICKSLNCNDITLEVRESNIPAQNLYKKFDFKEEGIRKGYYSDNGENAIIMWKRG